MVRTFISFKLGESIPEFNIEEAPGIKNKSVNLTYEEGSIGIKIQAYGESKEDIKNLLELTAKSILGNLGDYYFFGKGWELEKDGIKEKGEFTVKKYEN